MIQGTGLTGRGALYASRPPRRMTHIRSVRCHHMTFLYLVPTLPLWELRINMIKSHLYVVKEYTSKSIWSTVVPRTCLSETDVAVNVMLDCIAELGYTGHTVY